MDPKLLQAIVLAGCNIDVSVAGVSSQVLQGLVNDASTTGARVTYRDAGTQQGQLLVTLAKQYPGGVTFVF